MANRHLARSIVLQTLYEWDFRDLSKDEALKTFERNALEFASSSGDSVFMRTLLKHVIEKKKELDLIITKAAPDWPMEKISVVDRNILRLGLTELLFADKDEVPPKVAINEAIELAKTFGGDTSGRFVNGVLGAVYKEMGEPGKNDSTPRKKKLHEIPDEEAILDRLVGAVVYAKNEGVLHLALVHDVFGHWTLSKGHLKEGEDIKKGVKRIVKDEIDLKVKPEKEIGKNEYIAFDPEKGKIRKQVSYILCVADFSEIKLLKEGGLDDARWFKAGEIEDLNFYDDVLPIVTTALQILAKKK